MALGGNPSQPKRSEEETFGDLYFRSFGFFPGGRAAMKGLYEDLIHRGHSYSEIMRGTRALFESKVESRNKQPLCWDIIRAIEQTRPLCESSRGCPHCHGFGALPVLKETFKNVFRSPKDRPSDQYFCGVN